MRLNRDDQQLNLSLPCKMDILDRIGDLLRHLYEGQQLIQYRRIYSNWYNTRDSP